MLRKVAIVVPSVVVALVAGWAAYLVLSASLWVLDQWVVPHSVPRPPGLLLYQIGNLLNALLGIAAGLFFGARCCRKLSAFFERTDTMQARRESMSREG